MGAPKGNKFWKLRDKDGRNKLFESPESLLSQCYAYFDWCNDNPLITHDVVRGGDMAGSPLEIKNDRPYTIDGLCVFLGITYPTILNYENAESHKDFFKVITHVKQIIRDNQLSGAIVGNYNSNIVARINGLTDSQKHEHSGEIKQKHDLSNLTYEQLKDLAGTDTTSGKD
jgi:hypothetical protein